MENKQQPKCFNFTIPGKPMGQPRVRFARMGKFVRTYDPAEATSYKATIIHLAKAAGVTQIVGPVRMFITAIMPRPKRLCRKSDKDSQLWAECKPDWDNIGKIVSDALNGVAYADDAQIVSGTVEKVYHEKDGMPSVIVSVLSTDD
jgi:Holliday junction resolvase RusA-like endonuclease